MPRCVICNTFLHDDDVFVMMRDSDDKPYCRGCYIQTLEQEVARLRAALRSARAEIAYACNYCNECVDLAYCLEHEEHCTTRAAVAVIDAALQDTPPPNVPENGPGGSPEAVDPVCMKEQDRPRVAPDKAGHGTGGELEWMAWIEDITSRYAVGNFIRHLDDHLAEESPDVNSTINLVALILYKVGIDPRVLRPDYTACNERFERHEKKHEGTGGEPTCPMCGGHEIIGRDSILPSRVVCSCFHIYDIPDEDGTGGEYWERDVLRKEGTG